MGNLFVQRGEPCRAINLKERHAAISVQKGRCVKNRNHNQQIPGFIAVYGACLTRGVGVSLMLDGAAGGAECWVQTAKMAGRKLEVGPMLRRSNALIGPMHEGFDGKCSL